MLVTTINSENINSFSDLLAPDIAAVLFDEGVYALGAICEDDGRRLPVGTLVFSIDEGDSDGESLTAAVLRWLYIDKEYRTRGYADELVANFITIAGQAGVEDVICDLPMPGEYDELCAYLESIGFIFSVVEQPVLSTTLQPIYSHPALSKALEPGACVPLSKVDSVRFAKILRKIGAQPYAPSNLSIDKAFYDADISCVTADDGGALLVTERPGCGLELMFAGAFENGQRNMEKLTLFSIKAAGKKFSADTPLQINCFTRAGAVTIAKLFPGAQPRLLRRGYMSIYDLLMSEE